MERPEFMQQKIKEFAVCRPEWNGMVYKKQKGMNGLPQGGILAQKLLEE
jgi:hypothetical protein